MQPNLAEEKALIMAGGVISSIANGETDKPSQVQVKSRFGAVFIQPEKAITFLHGMPGIPGTISFCLTELPNAKSGQFKLLQCLNDHALSFIVVPSTYDNQLLEEADMDDACAVLGINKDNLVLLFIVTSHETPSGRRLSINAKAPVFVDSTNRLAVQYIFQSNTYEIQHFIS